MVAVCLFVWWRTWCCLLSILLFLGDVVVVLKVDRLVCAWIEARPRATPDTPLSDRRNGYVFSYSSQCDERVIREEDPPYQAIAVSRSPLHKSPQRLRIFSIPPLSRTRKGKHSQNTGINTVRPKGALISLLPLLNDPTAHSVPTADTYETVPENKYIENGHCFEQKISTIASAPRHCHPALIWYFGHRTG